MELNINDLMEKFNEDSPFMVRYRLEAEKYSKEELGLQKNRNQKIDYSGEVFKESSNKDQTRTKYEDVEKGQVGLYYDVFYYEGVYEFEESSYYSEEGKGLKESRLGVRKAVNDIFYSEKDFEKRYIKIKKSILRNNLIYEYLNEAEKIIDSYRELLDLQYSIETDQISLEEYEKLTEISEKKFEVGEGLQLEVDYLKAEKLEVEENLSYSKALKKIRISELSRDTGLYLNDRRRLDLFPDEGQVEIRTNNFDLERSYKEELMKREEVRLKKRREQDEFTLGGDYDTERELWSLRFSLTGSIFDYPLESDLGESEIEIHSHKISYLEKIREGELKILEEEYNHLKNILEIKFLKMKNREKSTEIAKKMYSLGYITAKKLIDEKKDARVSQTEYSGALNKLGAFEYKMFLRKKIEDGQLVSLKF